MSDIFQIANIGLLDGQQRLNAVSMNAASASLPGYRRHVVPGRAFDAALAAADVETGSGASAAASMTVGSQRATQQVNLQPGALIATGRALDVAIDSDAPFFALTDGTQTWLTRAGSFHLNDESVLVGERGLRLVGTQGDIHLPGSDVTVEADGRITRQGVTVATLQLFQPIDPASVLAAEGTLLTAPSGVQPTEASAVRVRGGALEASNTDDTREMLGLMSLTRQFESLSRIVQNYDDVLGRVIQKLGES